jgi:hypothetical protein
LALSLRAFARIPSTVMFAQSPMKIGATLIRAHRTDKLLLVLIAQVTGEASYCRPWPRHRGSAERFVPFSSQG